MKTFIGWRAVGYALRWARQQDGVTHTYEPGAWLGHEWDRNSADVVCIGSRGQSGDYGLMVDLADGRHLESSGLSAADMLRVLAALDLIPALLAEVRDERYARCVCKRVLFWRPETPELPARWRHLDRRAYIEYGLHRAEVVE